MRESNPQALSVHLISNQAPSPIGVTLPVWGRRVRARTTFVDTFTPLTVKRFTGHFNGAVYGAPNKLPSGKTPYANLFLCGTDQGFLGIVGAMVSGIAMANAHVLVQGAK